MRELFVFDKKNYLVGGKTGYRPSCRAIIIKDDTVALIHSLKFGYYKFPGGGIEKNESHVKALIREVKEESGLVVKPDTIEEFGYVKRIEKGKFDDIFVQENYYYLCDVEAEKSEQKLDLYEEEAMFTLEYVNPSKAIEENQKLLLLSNHSNHYSLTMVERENRVLRIIIDELMSKGVK